MRWSNMILYWGAAIIQTSSLTYRIWDSNDNNGKPQEIGSYIYKIATDV